MTIIKFLPIPAVNEMKQKWDYIINLYSRGFGPKLRCQQQLPNNPLYVDHMHLDRFVQLLAGTVVRLNKDWNLDYNENLDIYENVHNVVNLDNHGLDHLQPTEPYDFLLGLP
eukprot:TRINITY_DN19236_c0_g2_i1.p1 TRINITY_DN19236_c0_g2~~TRINITY_DN19236_c0_g2_i1.p1  ORF type:complete len:112 (+),score=13.07 TRINITY_DN19236_c0_g2_i1:204-539(+)